MDGLTQHLCRQELVTWVPCRSKTSGPGTTLTSINTKVFRVKSKAYTARDSLRNSIFHKKLNYQYFVEGKLLDASESMALWIHQNS